jgi:2-phosphosulfolactate phosphatase
VTPSVVIDCFFEGFNGYRRGYAIVAVDVIRATTTAVTAVTSGRRCFPAASLDEAGLLAKTLENPLLVGELGGEMPYGFDLTNSPAQLAAHSDASRPVILLSTSGTKLIMSAPAGVFVACLRNQQAQVDWLIEHHAKVQLIGAGTRGEFREEDQMCCAWIAEGLIEAGYRAENVWTTEMVDRWSGAAADAFVGGKSTEFLRRTGQLEDLEFILATVNDTPNVFARVGAEVSLIGTVDGVRRERMMSEARKTA